MKFLLDVQSKKVASKKSKFDQLVRGQLCTPLTNYKTWDGEFAIDNGAYSGLNRNACLPWNFGSTARTVIADAIVKGKDGRNYRSRHWK